MKDRYAPRHHPLVSSLLISFSLSLCACNAQTAHQRRNMVSVVPDLPPDSVPTAIWNEIHSPANMEKDAPEWSAPFPRNIVLLMFQERTTRDEKQHAIDAIHGLVVGGAPLRRGGYYYVRIRDDGTSRPLFRAIEKLKSFPQVQLATPELPDVSPLGRNGERR